MNLAPGVGILSCQILPLWRVMMWWQSHKPKPIPNFVSPLNRSNRWSFLSSEIPGPLSKMVILISWSVDADWIVIKPFLGVFWVVIAFIELFSKLTSTCWISLEFIGALTSGANSKFTLIWWAANSGFVKLNTFWIKALMSCWLVISVSLENNPRKD